MREEDAWISDETVTIKDLFLAEGIASHDGRTVPTGRRSGFKVRIAPDGGHVLQSFFICTRVCIPEGKVGRKTTLQYQIENRDDGVIADYTEVFTRDVDSSQAEAEVLLPFGLSLAFITPGTLTFRVICGADQREIKVRVSPR